MSIRTRFAPSPTGYLHIGGARTALFNWLYARHHGGTFVLRIEDTDDARNTQEAVEVILSSMQWLGLDWDEGPTSGDVSSAPKGNRGPYFQSQRRDLYQSYVEKLLSSDKAYEHEGAIKFRMTREPVVIPDLVCGDVTRHLTDREEADPDFVIVRSDGKPVFHLVNVIDDLEMGITHVIRGEDHLSNTSRHIALYQALGADCPHFAHIPLILNGDGSKMSKRDLGASMTTYMEEGFVSEAVVNYLCLLGWSPKDDRQKMDLNEVIELFDLPQILRHNARFDMDKLVSLNGQYLAELSADQYRGLAIPALKKAGVCTDDFISDYLHAAIDSTVGKFKQMSEIGDYAGFYFKKLEDMEWDAEAAGKQLIPENHALVSALRAAFVAEESFVAANIQAAFKSTAKALGVKVGALIHPLRLACTGQSNGPSLYHLVEILGKDRVLASIDQALNRMKPND
ncbi:glutamate--tRNA ligase [Verrucomicrobia bacterium]|nr:glutamate--tRNA ligase [Verrucomicrobiota bacterium]